MSGRPPAWNGPADWRGARGQGSRLTALVEQGPLAASQSLPSAEDRGGADHPHRIFYPRFLQPTNCDDLLEHRGPAQITGVCHHQDNGHQRELGASPPVRVDVKLEGQPTAASRDKGARITRETFQSHFPSGLNRAFGLTPPVHRLTQQRTKTIRAQFFNPLLSSAPLYFPHFFSLLVAFWEGFFVCF